MTCSFFRTKVDKTRARANNGKYMYLIFQKYNNKNSFMPIKADFNIVKSSYPVAILLFEATVIGLGNEGIYQNTAESFPKCPGKWFNFMK